MLFEWDELQYLICMEITYHQLRLDYAKALNAFLDQREASAESLRCFEEGLGRSRAWMAAHGGESASAEECRKVACWLERRRQGEPWAYILGWTLWRERRFMVGPEVLIPRPETEMLLEAALEVGRRLEVNRVVDVGTGSGILAITLALESPWAVTAVDLSLDALETAGKNAKALGAKVEFAHGDLLDPVQGPLGLVVSNPPYVDPRDQPGLQRELAFEPAMALFSEEEGLYHSTALLKTAKFRAASGCLLEIGAGQGAELSRRARAFGWKNIQVYRDMAGHDRVLMAL